VEALVVMSLIRVLVVDDAECWRLFVSSMLRAEPSFEVVFEASDGLQAVQAAQDLQPTIVLLDIGLPGLNGIQAGEWIRTVAPDTKIVFLSQETDADIVRATLELGALGYVLKFDAARELIAAIHSVVRGERFVSRSMTGRRFMDGGYHF
jgi:DNA-binding NarL/FixJ family response regulator